MLRSLWTLTVFCQKLFQSQNWIFNYSSILHLIFLNFRESKTNSLLSESAQNALQSGERYLCFDIVQQTRCKDKEFSNKSEKGYLSDYLKCAFSFFFQAGPHIRCRWPERDRK